MADFCVNLKKALEDKQCSQAELSRITGISKSFISQYLSGKFKPKADKLKLISKALNVSEASLLGLDGEIIHKSYTTNNLREIPIIKNNEVIGSTPCGCEEGEYCFYVCDDSDNLPFICKNDMLLICKCAYYEKRIYALMQNDKIIFRKCEETESGFHISTLSENAQNCTFLGDYSKEITIIGRVDEIRRKL